MRNATEQLECMWLDVAHTLQIDNVGVDTMWSYVGVDTMWSCRRVELIDKMLRTELSASTGTQEARFDGMLAMVKDDPPKGLLTLGVPKVHVLEALVRDEVRTCPWAPRATKGQCM